jgi:hypothetical protein
MAVVTHYMKVKDNNPGVWEGHAKRAMIVETQDQANKGWKTPKKIHKVSEGPFSLLPGMLFLNLS